MFGENKQALLTTNLIIKVRKYKDQKPWFCFHDTPAVADETKARAVAEKLNELTKLEPQDEGWQIQFYSVPMIL